VHGSRPRPLVSILALSVRRITWMEQREERAGRVLGAFIHPVQLQRDLDRLQWTTAGLACVGRCFVLRVCVCVLHVGVAWRGVCRVALAGTWGYLAWGRWGVLRARRVVTDGVYLVRSGGLARPAPLGEFAVRAGRPELRMSNGLVVLMDEKLAVRVQLDASYHPAPPVRPPTPQAVHGHSRMTAYARKPALVFLSPDEAPRAVYDPERGYLKFGTPFPAADATGASSTSAGDDNNDAHAPGPSLVSAASLFQSTAPPPSWMAEPSNGGDASPQLHPDEEQRRRRQ
jgi:hypothetical protein